MAKNNTKTIPPTHELFKPRSPGLNQKTQVFKSKKQYSRSSNDIDYCPDCYELVEDCMCDNTYN